MLPFVCFITINLGLMNAIPERPRDAFVQNAKTKRTDPVNLLATDRIKCLNCEKYVEISQLHSHLEQHSKVNSKINNQNIRSSVLGTQTQSSTPIIYINHNYNYVPPIDVKTFNPNDLPLPDGRKKSMSLPQHHERTPTPSKPIRMLEVKRTPSIQWSEAQTAHLNQKSRIRDSITKQDYFQQVKLDLQRSTIRVERRSVSCLKNRYLVVCQDDHVDEQKTNPEMFQPSSKMKPTFTITPRDQTDPKTSRKTPQYQTPLKPTRNSRFSVVPADSNYLAANTPVRILSTSKKQPTSTYSKRSPESFIRQRVSYGLNDNEFACINCGGFYCPVCKATVPPQYRKPPYLPTSFAHTHQKEEHSTMLRSAQSKE